MFLFKEQPKLRYRQDNRRRAWVQRTALLCGFPRVPNGAQLLRWRWFPDSLRSSCPQVQALRDAEFAWSRALRCIQEYRTLETSVTECNKCIYDICHFCFAIERMQIALGLTLAFTDAIGMKKSSCKNTPGRKREGPGRESNCNVLCYSVYRCIKSKLLSNH